MRSIRTAASVSCLVFLTAAAISVAQESRPAASPSAATTAPSPARVHNSDIHDSLNADMDGAPAIAIVAARNGACSGKVVLTGSPLQDVKAVCTDLRKDDSTIPAERVRIRYGAPWTRILGKVYGGLVGTDILLEKPLEDFTSGQVAVWATVEVPKAAAAGDYAGQLTISVKGGGPFQVPVKLSVQDWTLPDTQDYRTWIEVIQSPDNLAAEYKLTPWSDRHWDMIGRSLKLIGSTGSRVIYLLLIAHANFGNEESMVRWIRKPAAGGDANTAQYEQDYTNFDRYLDTAVKNMGKPKIVTLWAWDVHVMKPGAGTKHKEAVTIEEATGGPPVTVYDPATKKTELVYLPPYETPEGMAMWKPVWKELRQRLEKRGLWGAAMIGVSSDIWPSKEQVTALAELSGGLSWSSSTHDIGWLAPQTNTGKGALPGEGFIKYVSAVLQFEMTINPSLPGARTYGWKRPELIALYWRLGEFVRSTPARIRYEPTYAITGDRRGLGHIGGDFWPAIKNARGLGSASVSTRYPESKWHSQAIGSYVLAPGADGPVGTVRLEVLREGVQECEARIAIETVLTDATRRAMLGEELAKRAQDFLDEHQRNAWRARGCPEEDFQTRGHIPYYRTFSYDIVGYPKPRWDEAAGAQWFQKSDWAKRVGDLFTLAGEVTRRAAS